MIQWKKIILSTIAAIGIACFAGGTADAASVKIDEKTFPNACVRTFANKQDTNHDGELSDAEIKAVTKLDWNGQNLYTYGVTSGMEIDFTGMEIFTNLKQVTIEQLFQGGKHIAAFRSGTGICLRQLSHSLRQLKHDECRGV